MFTNLNKHDIEKALLKQVKLGNRLLKCIKLKHLQEQANNKGNSKCYV